MTLLTALLAEVAVAECMKHDRPDITVAVLPQPTSVTIRAYEPVRHRRVQAIMDYSIVRGVKDINELRKSMSAVMSGVIDDLLGVRTKSAWQLRLERNR